MSVKTIAQPVSVALILMLVLGTIAFGILDLAEGIDVVTPARDRIATAR
jgi:hypothetical protein